ncbi:MAG: hypothetical protein ACYTX0_53490 [Nostoc sp.]
MIYKDKETLSWWEIRAIQATNIEDIDLCTITAVSSRAINN